MNNAPTQNDSHWPYRLAVLLACVTFPLIWVGGLVTTYKAGMAVPDWPGTYGYNLFLYPWQTWIAGPFDLFIEHGHRLLGAGAGLCTLALVAAVFWFDRRLWMRFAVITALCLVLAQGSLGGARVLFDERQFALIHGCLGPVFFAFTVALAAFTSSWWRSSAATATAAAPRWQLLTGATLLLAFVQLVAGAHLRHVPDDPIPGYFRLALVFHLLLAALLAAHAVYLTMALLAAPPKLRNPALVLSLLVAMQLGLGGAAWVVKYAWPDWFAGWAFAERHVVVAESLSQALTVTAHVANGSLILATSTLLALRATRLVRPLEITSRSSLGGAPRHSWRQLAGGLSV